MTALSISRRGLIRVATAAAPLGLIGPWVFAGNRIAIQDDRLARRFAGRRPSQ